MTEKTEEDKINIKENEIIEKPKQKLSPRKQQKKDDKIVFKYIIQIKLKKHRNQSIF
jgi:hypothetical protein